ncbi:benzoylformate decarboxylase [Streptomyces iconiensis]|uniref:Benzoylformate decarboxylase n=1 Tax=Streptomyces iconiensis TaxID=1384038 RepID=A0ABT6ZWK3_9ACTN|nr:benzoylformate decarboxylase [Streptomyces iconiensis]MDJ1133459.1 benzoylformate decarboxylase [Streptomyces iconiensis]
MAVPPTVREAVVALCRDTGMTTVFGNPGSTELRMFRDWPDDFRYVLGLQESTAVAMAAGHALGTGRAALVSLHSAGGVGHALGAVFNAYRDRVPVVVVAGQQTRALLPLRPFLGADEPTRFPEPYVKFARQPERAADVPAALAEAHRVAMSHPRGPVFLSVPEDDWDRPAAYVPPRTVYSAHTADPGVLARLAHRLDTAARPALVVGPGVDDEHATREVTELAERTRAAVWISPLSGRSGFDERHPLFQGFLPPVPDRLAAQLAPYDLVVALGAPLFTYHVDTGGPPLAAGTELWHLDCDPAQAAWLPVGTSVVTTLRPAVGALAGLVRAADRAAPAPRPAPTRAPAPAPVTVTGTAPSPSPAPAPVGGRITVEALFDLLADRLPRDTVLVEETPSHREILHDRLSVSGPGRFLTTGSGALGWGLPLAVGRALADRRRVVCVLGDGSALYSVQALWTAVRHRAPVTYLLLDNGGYSAVRGLARRLAIRDVPGTDIGGIDFALLAASFGCPGELVEDPAALPAALDRALAPGDDEGPLLLHVRVPADDSPPYGTGTPDGAGASRGTGLSRGTGAPSGSAVSDSAEVPFGVEVPGRTGAPSGVEVPGRTGAPSGVEVPGRTGAPSGTAVPDRTGAPYGADAPGRTEAG